MNGRVRGRCILFGREVDDACQTLIFAPPIRFDFSTIMKF